MSDFNNNILIQNNSVIEIIDLIINKKYQYNKFTVYDMFVRQILFDTKQSYTIYNIFNVMKWIVYNGYLKNNFVIDLSKQVGKYNYIRSYNNFYKFNNIIIKITNVSQLLKYNQNNDNDGKDNQNQDKDEYMNNNSDNQNDKNDSDEVDDNNEEDDKYDDEYKIDNKTNKDINDIKNINNQKDNKYDNKRYKDIDDETNKNINKNIIYNNNKIQQINQNKEVGNRKNQEYISYQQSLKLFRNTYSFNNNDKNNHNNIDKDREDIINTDSVKKVSNSSIHEMIEDNDKIGLNKTNNNDRDNINNNDNSDNANKDIDNYKEIIF